MPAPLELLDHLRRQILIRRRTLAALCLGLAVWGAISATAAPPPATVPLWTAARDLPGGTTLAAADFRRTGFAPGSVPDSALRDLRDVVGRTLLAPLGRGEVAVSGQVLGRSALARYPGTSAIGLRIPDAGTAALLDPGDRVDLLASDLQAEGTPTGRAAEVLVHDAVVLTLPPPDDGTALGTPTTGRLVVFAVPSATIQHVAEVGITHFLTVIWSR